MHNIMYGCTYAHMKMHMYNIRLAYIYIYTKSIVLLSQYVFIHTYEEKYKNMYIL